MGLFPKLTMDEQQIRKIVREELEKAAGAAKKMVVIQIKADELIEELKVVTDAIKAINTGARD
jgi:hypothetical protein